MRKILLFLAVAAAAYWSLQQADLATAPMPEPPLASKSTPNQRQANASAARDDSDLIRRAFENRQSDVQVQASGIVERVLTDDQDGARHQRFIVKLAGGQTVLIAHNIDLAPRVAPLSVGDRIEFFGEYEWNAQGGVIHWTHRDPAGRHVAGWIKRDGEVFQ